MKPLLASLLLVSVALNVLLWKRSSEQGRELAARQAVRAEVEALREQGRLSDAKQQAANPMLANTNANEVARLRNEIGQLRRQIAELQKPAPPSSLRGVPSSADVNTRFIAATQELAELHNYADEREQNIGNLISNLANASAQQLEDLKRRAQSAQCVQNLKRISLAALEWADDHQGTFPADFLTMREKFKSPSVLFCPGAPSENQPTDWSKVNWASLTYLWHGASADLKNPESVLTSCPIHGHIGLADGSASMTRPGQTLGF